MNKYRTHNCSELSEKEINSVVHISGWLHRKRDHGNLLFIDLRNEITNEGRGILQLYPAMTVSFNCGCRLDSPSLVVVEGSSTRLVIGETIYAKPSFHDVFDLDISSSVLDDWILTT